VDQLQRSRVHQLERVSVVQLENYILFRSQHFRKLADRLEKRYRRSLEEGTVDQLESDGVK
jgi:hypothetical protein